ncbi:hypothetical protein [Tenacibaculum soleae]|uniref:hypothetical protein n=1 Tax=Tenacibaculum soleae TaxID=447689 RepID=UPI00230182E7|nr:hypothetical protein [Tenacibaculum soleae]
MKRIITLLLVLFTLSMQSQDFIKTYEGLLKGKQSYLKLYSNSGKVSGSYFNINNCKNEEIIGVISGNIILFKLNYKEYKGEILENGKIQGVESENENNKFYFLPSSFNFQDEFNKCSISLEKKEKTTLVIYDIKVLKYPNTRKSGKAWDSAFGSYKPDVFIKILDAKQKVLYSQQSVLTNHTGKPFILGNIVSKEKGRKKTNYITKFAKEQYKNGLYFCLYDFDNNSENDRMASIGVVLKKSYNTNKYKETLEYQGFKIEVQFYFK